MSDLTEETRKVAQRWFDALSGGDFDTALDTLAEDVEWINYAPVPGYNDDMKWIGSYRGRDAVLDTLKIFTEAVEVKFEKLTNLAAIPATGFTFSCFPVKIERASAGWIRAVVLMED